MGVDVRQVFVHLHRWAGLATALFLAVVGLTGSLLAFYGELDRLCAPQLFAAARPGTPQLALSVLAERAEALLPKARVTAVTYAGPDQVGVWYTPKIDPSTGQPYDLGFDEFFLDPWTGAELGRRTAGDLSEGRINLMTFVYRVHWQLALGSVGSWVLGIVALIWTVDCIGGLYLALPRKLAGPWRKWWRTAWTVKWRSGALRANFDIHRAASLWLLGLLFVFAWSSVMMNIRPVYEPVMRALFDYQASLDPTRSSAAPRDRPRLDWLQAEARGRVLMREQASRRGFVAGEPLNLAYFPESGMYIYEVRGSRDVFERAPKGGGTSVTFDGDTGALAEIFEPTGEHAGNTVESWLYALHMARVFGLPYRLLVCVLGVVLTAICATGVYVWHRKKQARRAYAAQSRPPLASSRIRTRP